MKNYAWDHRAVIATWLGSPEHYLYIMIIDSDLGGDGYDKWRSREGAARSGAVATAVRGGRSVGPSRGSRGGGTEVSVWVGGAHWDLHGITVLVIDVDIGPAGSRAMG